MVNYNKERAESWDKFKANSIKARLREYRKDLAIIDSLAERVVANRDRMDLQSAWSSSDAVQGGGTSQEDRLNGLIDKIRADERDIKLIELENRALIHAIDSLSDPELVRIVYDKWVFDRKSIEELAREFHISVPTCWRWSNKALIEIYEKLYILTPSEVDRR